MTTAKADWQLISFKTPSVREFSEAIWRSGVAAAWARRNSKTVEELDRRYMVDYGITRTALDEHFLQDVPRDAKICEVGCSQGLQSLVLAQLGFRSFWGADVAKDVLSNSHNVAATLYKLPFQSGAFDLVFTSGVLIHVPPDSRADAMAELLRITRRWVWAFEMFGPVTLAEWPVTCAGPTWAGHFAQGFLDHEPTLKLVRRGVIPYCKRHRAPQEMFLLEKP